MLTLCGNLLKLNKQSKKQVAWVEDTRSTILNAREKQELLAVMSGDMLVAENPDLMAIAIEFRLKPLVSANSVASANTDGESKAYRQLKNDCAALVSEHPTQVCYTLEPEQVKQASKLIF